MTAVGSANSQRLFGFYTKLSLWRESSREGEEQQGTVATLWTLQGKRHAHPNQGSLLSPSAGRSPQLSEGSIEGFLASFVEAQAIFSPFRFSSLQHDSRHANSEVSPHSVPRVLKIVVFNSS